MSKYDAWNLDSIEACGQCAVHTELMAEEFPELTRVRGHYHCPIWGVREHWWLTLNGHVIDPTAAQFPSKGHGDYVPWVEGAAEPTGMCLNCGDYCYGTSCCEECTSEFASSL